MNRLPLLILSLFIFSCSSHQDRDIASEEQEEFETMEQVGDRRDYRL